MELFNWNNGDAATDIMYRLYYQKKHVVFLYCRIVKLYRGTHNFYVKKINVDLQHGTFFHFLNIAFRKSCWKRLSALFR